MYPDLSFLYRWADEDFGCNVGCIEYADGMQIECYLPDNGSKEALELAAEIHQVSLEEEGYIWNESTNEYEYHIDENGMDMM